MICRHWQVAGRTNSDESLSDASESREQATATNSNDRATASLVEISRWERVASWFNVGLRLV